MRTLAFLLLFVLHPVQVVRAPDGAVLATYNPATHNLILRGDLWVCAPKPDVTSCKSSADVISWLLRNGPE